MTARKTTPTKTTPAAEVEDTTYLEPLSDADQAYWGADPDDNVVTMPETRHIGQFLFFRADGVPHKLPVRLKSSVMEELDEMKDDVASVLRIATEYASPTAAQAFAHLDFLAQTYVAKAYFEAFEKVAKSTMGESVR